LYPHFLRRWLDDAACPALHASTYASYDDILRLHLIPGLGRIPLAKLTPAESGSSSWRGGWMRCWAEDVQSGPDPCVNRFPRMFHSLPVRVHIKRPGAAYASRTLARRRTEADPAFFMGPSPPRPQAGRAH
jgi:hypothetical protein